MLAENYYEDVLLQLRKYKEMAEKAMEQISDADFFATLDPESNSIAILVKHMGGNMRSRWTDFLTSDGDKPDRARDTEFELDEADTRERLREVWEDGWARTFGAIEPLQADDLTRIVTIRGEEHTVMEAINRQLTHYAAHVGQIVLLAKHYAGDRWHTLSIPKGRSEDFDVAKSGQSYRPTGQGGG